MDVLCQTYLFKLNYLPKPLYFVQYMCVWPIQHVYLFIATFILKIGPFSLGNYLYVSITNIASTQKVSDSQNYVLNGCQMFVTNGDEW